MRSFQVDLAGMVDLLSRHIYSGPHIFVRELLQNAVDAITARDALGQADPSDTSRHRVRLRTIAASETNHAPRLVVEDPGIGLTEDEAVELLSTIGRSSKRDEVFGGGRAEYLGQFGIGMLASFMVASRIDVISKSCKPGASGDTIHWTGFADGTFHFARESSQESESSGSLADALPPELLERSSPGTTVILTARPDAKEWFEREVLIDLAQTFGSLLPLNVQVETTLADGSTIWRRITEDKLPWDAAKTELMSYCERTFGFRPLGMIPLEVPVLGVSGVGFVLPEAVSPGSGRHRVYTKRMLLGTAVDRILPDWAFFVRAVLNVDGLAPTASREQFRDDEQLQLVRDELGAQLKRWAIDTLSEPSTLTRKVLSTHHLALRAAALTDPEMLDLVANVLPFETTTGTRTLHMIARDDTVRYTTTTEAFRRVASVSRAQGITVVNAGYVYDADLIAQLAKRPGWNVEELEGDDLVEQLDVPDVGREIALAPALTRAREILAEADCDVMVRDFSPESTPSMLVIDREDEHRRMLDRERQEEPNRWEGLLDAFATEGDAAASERSHRTRTLVLNDRSTLVRRVLAGADQDVFAAAVTTLYHSALMQSGESLGADESRSMTSALEALMQAAFQRESRDQSHPAITDDRDQGATDQPGEGEA